PRTTQRPDGSLVVPEHQRAKHLRHILRRRGSSEEEVVAACRVAEQAPFGRVVQVADGLYIRNIEVGDARPVLNGDDQPDSLLLLKIAYEFLALECGEAIYERAFNPYRSLLLREGDGSVIDVECLEATDYEPFHGIVHECNTPSVQVQV